MAALRFNPPPQRVRLRRSNLFITLNTNWRPQRTNIAYANQVANDLQTAVHSVVTQPGFKQTFLLHRERGQAATPIAPGQVGRVDVKIAVEVGSLTGYLHAHVFIAIDHGYPTGGVQLDIPAFKAAIRAAGTTAPVQRLPYMHVRGFGTVQDLEDYMFKDYPGRTRDDLTAVQELAQRKRLIG